MKTPLSTGIPRALTIDPAFDVDNHTPFAPLAATTSLQESVRVDGWETEGYVNQSEADSENYELVDGEWVHTATETVAVDYHYITWVREAPLPGYPASDKSVVMMEYSDKAAHFENGEVTKFAPGYSVTAFAVDPDAGRELGEYDLGTFTNLAAGLDATVTFLARVVTEETPESFTPPETVDMNEIFTALRLPEFNQ